MWIKLLITAITLFLLFDEYFKVINKIKKNKRRKIILFTLAILSILSLIEVITEAKEGQELVKKANKIIIQSDTLISNTNSIIMDLEKNISSVEKSGNSIKEIDIVLKGVRDTLSNQVEILKTSVNKSKELVKLEKQKFELDGAKISALTTEIKLENNKIDSTFFDLKYSIVNEGQRDAININLKPLVLLFNSDLDIFKTIQIPYRRSFPNGLTEYSKGELTIKIGLPKEKLVNDYDKIILIYKCEYMDIILKKPLLFEGLYVKEYLKSSDIGFKLLNDSEFAKKVNKALINQNLKEYIIDIDKL